MVCKALCFSALGTPCSFVFFPIVLVVYRGYHVCVKISVIPSVVVHRIGMLWLGRVSLKGLPHNLADLLNVFIAQGRAIKVVSDFMLDVLFDVCHNSILSN